MKAFTELFEELDSTTSTLEKVAALKKYFSQTDSRNSLWAFLILTSRVQLKSLTSRSLREAFLHVTQYPDWLFEESYSQVGDTAETLSLLLNTLGLVASYSSSDQAPLYWWMEEEIPRLSKIKNLEEKSKELLKSWKKLTQEEIFIFNKLMTGGFRVGASEKTVVRALSEVYNVPISILTHRITGNLEATEKTFQNLISQDKTEVLDSQPYPFCLAYAWQDRAQEDWDPSQWAIEWKYDGIRSQVIRRNDQTWIWSRGEEEISQNFPDLKKQFDTLPNGTVLDGEVLVIKDDHIQSFQNLQKRLGRKKISKEILSDYPAGFMAYDCLEWKGVDIREKTFRERRQILETQFPQLKISPLVELKADASLEDLENLRNQSRQENAEGLMLKLLKGPYVTGRKKGYWWKHKVDPLTLDAVLIYAQAGTGRRANLYTDYTFALWKTGDDGEKTLVPFAKAYSGLDQKEIDALDHWIRRHTKEKFGPVRSLDPEQVFELGFEGLSLSNRHKSGIAVRFPRILRWRKDKKPVDADTLDNAFNLLKSAEVNA